MDKENNEIFRKKSLERLSSPEQLNDYLRVTNPSTWIVLASIIVLLLGLLVWSSFAVIESYVSGTAVADKGVLTVVFDDTQTAQKVETGMVVVIGDTQAAITSVGRDGSGRIIAVANAGVPDGTYNVKVGYKQTKIIQLLFN